MAPIAEDFEKDIASVERTLAVRRPDDQVRASFSRITARIAELEAALRDCEGKA